jgi:hypothetical protein
MHSIDGHEPTRRAFLLRQTARYPHHLRSVQIATRRVDDLDDQHESDTIWYRNHGIRVVQINSQPTDAPPIDTNGIQQSQLAYMGTQNTIN